ncbi:MAG TPA: hypothetical protein VM910_36935 [Bradyrhizobium sp.]|nr:hypothetical protein [Bradyrhizobium sp.]
MYPLVGGPPVWSTENMEAYIELLNEFTQLLEPRDVMELIWTKEAADASWEAARKAREKNGLPERKYQQRLQVAAEVRRLNGAAETAAAKPASALDHSRGLEAGFKHYQGLDIAQSRAMKRRDNALRLIARWRKGLAPKARALSDKFIAEEALAEHYDAAHLLADAETDNNADEAMEAAPPLAPAGEAAPPLAPKSEAAEAAPPLAFKSEAAEAAPPLALKSEATEAARPLVPAEDGPINWVGWLTGAEKYEWLALSKGAQKDFKQPVTSKRWLVEKLVVDRKVVRPDQVCPELAQYIPAIAEAAPTVAASAEAPQ